MQHKIMKATLAFACAACLSSAALADDKTLESSVSDGIQSAKAEKNDSFVTLNLENDLFGGGSDKHYTSGVRATYFNLGTPMPDFVRTAAKLIPPFTINKTTSVHYSAGQNLYTPKNISLATQNPDERPWAAFLYASAGLATVTNNHVDNVELTLGVIGPMALGKETQTFIHRHVSNSPLPKGWHNQLKNEPGVILSWERSWPERYSLQALGLTVAAVPHFGVSVGNVYTYANTGVSFRLSPDAGKWQDDPIRVRPAMPGTGAFLVPDKTLSWYMFAGLEGRAVARNIFLDGNTFADSYSIDKEPFVMDANAGIAVTYGGARLSYALIYRSEEFKGQKNGDVFGTMSMGLRF